MSKYKGADIAWKLKVAYHFDWNSRTACSSERFRYIQRGSNSSLNMLLPLLIA